MLSQVARSISAHAAKLMLCGVLIVSGCKSTTAARVSGYQSIHAGGVVLLWFADDHSVYIRSCGSALTSQTKIASVEEWRAACPRTNAADQDPSLQETILSRHEFASRGTLIFTTDTLFLPKLSQQTAELVRTYTGYLTNPDNRAMEGRRSLDQLASTLKKVEANLARESAAFNAKIAVADAAARAADPKTEVASEAQLTALFGDTLNSARATIATLTKGIEDLRVQKEAAKTAVLAYETKYKEVVAAFEKRYHQFLLDLLAPAVGTLSVSSQERDFEFALLDAIARSKGLLDAGARGENSTVESTTVEAPMPPMNLEPLVDVDANEARSRLFGAYDELSSVLDGTRNLDWGKQRDSRIVDGQIYESGNGLRSGAYYIPYTENILIKDALGPQSAYFTLEKTRGPLFVMFAKNPSIENLVIEGTHNLDDPQMPEKDSKLFTFGRENVHVFVRNMRGSNATIMQLILVPAGRDDNLSDVTVFNRLDSCFQGVIGLGPRSALIYAALIREPNRPLDMKEVEKFSGALLRTILERSAKSPTSD